MTKTPGLLAGVFFWAWRVGLRKGAAAEMIPIRAVTSVTTKKGLRNTRLTIIAAGNEIEANVGHDEAEAVKATILRLMAG